MCYFQVGKTFHNKNLLLHLGKLLTIRSTELHVLPVLSLNRYSALFEQELAPCSGSVSDAQRHAALAV